MRTPSPDTAPRPGEGGLPRIMVAPNGARRTKADHPALPVTDAELVACAVACHAAGADGLHAHIRDSDGRHLLDAPRYRDLLAALREAVPGMALQITTEAVGRYDAEIQMQVALGAGADMVSASVREIARAGTATARAFYARCRERGIAVQHILYDRSDGDLLAEILPPDRLHDPALQLIYVLGRYSETGLSDPADLQPFLDWASALDLTPDWALCAFGPTETDCLRAAARAGGKCRVGFENSLHLSDGTLSADNADKVRDLIACLRTDGTLA